LIAEPTTMANWIRPVVQARHIEIHVEEDNQIQMQATQTHAQMPWEIQVLIQILTFNDATSNC